MRTVKFTVENNICVSCGICKGICPRGCIDMVEKDGNYIPAIGGTCIHCGLCFTVCPGKGMIREESDGLETDDLIGSYQRIVNAWSRDEQIRHYGASGGVTTTIIRQLLKDQLYDEAFVVTDCAYDHYVETEMIRAAEADRLIDFRSDLRLSTKSRYIPVGHGMAVKHMLSNPNDRIIFVGTSCAITGLLNVIRQRKLNRDNYLFIGLFCDSVMNYHVWDYFGQRRFTRGKKLTGLHFKNKESGGWPGNIKMLFSDGGFRYYDKSYRMEIKPYFKPERCNYCVDKLNVRADISLGDNYTGSDASSLGSNTVIIRTEKGVDAWNHCCDYIDQRETAAKYLIKAQLLEDRAHNIEYAGLKEKAIKEKTGFSIDMNAMGKRGTGACNIKDFAKRMNKSSRKYSCSGINRSLIIPHIKRGVKVIIKKILRRKSL